MKLKLLTLPLLLVVSAIGGIFSTEEKTPAYLDADLAQCHATTQQFASLADDPEFRNIHLDPLPFDEYQESGKMITYPIVGGEKANAYFIKAKKASNEYLFVVHEWYGLNAYVKNESEKFAEQFKDMNIIALDLYDGKVAENSEKAGEYMKSVKTERALAIINGAQEFAGKKAKIYTVGWCFGGGWSLQAAIEMEGQAAGAVMFYGMPEKDQNRLKSLKCDVLAFFATQDQWINQDVANQFEQKMNGLDQKLTMKSYDAGHGFANPSNPVYNEEAASDAYKLMFDFITARR